MTIQTYRYQGPRRPKEGLRLGTTRYAPRGVSLSRCASEDYFDQRIPVIAPSAALLRAMKNKQGITEAIKREYRAQMKEVVPASAIELLAKAHAHVPFVIGCFCSDPAQCHQIILAALLNAARPRNRMPRELLHEELATFVQSNTKELGAPSARALTYFAESTAR